MVALQDFFLDELVEIVLGELGLLVADGLLARVPSHLIFKGLFGAGTVRDKQFYHKKALLLHYDNELLHSLHTFIHPLVLQHQPDVAFSCYAHPHEGKQFVIELVLEIVLRFLGHRPQHLPVVIYTAESPPHRLLLQSTSRVIVIGVAEEGWAIQPPGLTIALRRTSYASSIFAPLTFLFPLCLGLQLPVERLESLGGASEVDLFEYLGQEVFYFGVFAEGDIFVLGEFDEAQKLNQ